MDELAALVEQVPTEVLDYIESLEGRVEKAEKTAEEAVAKADSPEEPSDDPIAKALSDLPEEISKAFKETQDRLAEAEKALEAERLAKADAEWTDKARSVDGLIDDPAEFGKELRQVAETSPELADKIIAKLQAANSRFSKADLFSESGHSQPAAGSAEEKVKAIAKAAFEADPSKSLADHEADTWERNPDLYDQYTEERRGALKS